MILDNEGQRINLLEIINQVPVTGVMEEVIKIVSMLKGLKHDIQTATIADSNVVSITKDEIKDDESV